ncbi:MAG: Wadjet anti-phage system protein JetD domain-containing protein [Pseudonocardia sp.]|uniref:Wadjet anti-phage system protein JetD domain-containing protein n=1 Tax=Pseudonocardia sp. TaxID=60912 RepID=UPI003D0E5634
MTVTAPATETLSPLAARLADVIGDARTGRIPLDVLYAAAHRADTSLAGAADARARLRAVCDELAEAGIVRLPRVGGTGWETLPRPALPRFVTRVGRPGFVADPPDIRPVTATAWHADLRWVPAFLRDEHPTPGERALLDGVQELLAVGGAADVVPVQERSVRLTGDEKALGPLLRGRLFREGRLTRELLGIRRARWQPIARHVGDGPITLVVENVATWESLADALPDDGTVGQVVWGMGNQLGVVLEALAEERPEELSYFGDLDVGGLEIARRGEMTAEAVGLPALRPSTLYAWLLDEGEPQPAGPYAGDIAELTAWLPDGLRGPVADLLRSDTRLAQEWIGREQLLETDLRDLR